jgi:hypothetical protein
VRGITSQEQQMGDVMQPGLWEQVVRIATQYYGVDWAVTVTVFISMFLLGDKKIAGFIMGMFSTLLALVFSFQIESIANGITALVLFALYLRGFLKWRGADAMERQAPG